MHNFYANAPSWGNDGFEPPHENASAKPLKTERVSNARVVHVIDNGAKYRGAIFSGTFALADYQKDSLGKKLWDFVHVQVLWHGQRLKKQCPEFHIDLSRCTVETGYTGRVTSNIGSRNKPLKPTQQPGA
jgi:hypothetical protein